MYHLLLTACLLAEPQECEPRLLPAATATTQADCLIRAERIAPDWLARHPGLSGQSLECVPTASLPALEPQEIARGVYLHRGPAEQISPQNGGRIANLSFVIGDTVAVIDAGASRAEGEALFAAIRNVTDKPISHLILTHMHPDHIFGAEVFAEAGATLVAHHRLPDAVGLRAASWMGSIPLQTGTGAMAGTHIAPIDLPIKGPTRIDIGGRSLWLTPHGTAHTDNDLTAFDEGARVLFTGDLIFQGLTPSIDGSLLGWLDWIDAGPGHSLPDLSLPGAAPGKGGGNRNNAAGDAPALIVPGHGPVLSDWDDSIGPLRAYLAALRDETRRQIMSGAALSQAAPAIVRALQPQAADWADFDAITARNAATAFSELEWE